MAKEKNAPQPEDSQQPDQEAQSAVEPETTSGEGEQATPAPDSAPEDVLADLEAQITEISESMSREAELLADLQRLQAEFMNYKARVERDRDVARNAAIAEVLRSLLPALDDLARAEAHGDLEGSPFAAVANKLRTAGDKFGLKQFGAKGDAFNPELHDALVQTPNAEVTENTVADVVEPGYQLGERLLRPAKVAVFIPAE